MQATGNAQNAGGLPAPHAPSVSDEFRLLLLCARTRVTAAQHELIRKLACGELDWEFTLGKAYWHSLTPLLYRNLNAVCSDCVPAQVLGQLESHYLASANRTLVLTAELIRVLRILESANISAVPYKGPALASLAYGNVALRKFCDLDLVVRPRDILRAKSLLIEHGYQWHRHPGQVTGPGEIRKNRFWHEYNFVHPDCNTVIDLHWGISNQRFPFDIDMDDLWKDLVPAHLLGQNVRVFPAPALLLFLCVHGSKDLWWKRLGWICDVGQTLATTPHIDWPATFRLASETGTRRMFLLGLALAGGLLQAPIPDQVWGWIRSDRAVQTLERYVRHRLFDPATLRDRALEKPRFRLRVRERLRDRIPVLRHLLGSAFVALFVPREQDRASVKLSGSLSALYYLVRPARLVRRLWLQSTRRSDTGS